VQAGIKAARFQGRNPDKQSPVEHIKQSSDQGFVECDCHLILNKVIEEWINHEHYCQYTSQLGLRANNLVLTLKSESAIIGYCSNLAVLKLPSSQKKEQVVVITQALSPSQLFDLSKKSRCTCSAVLKIQTDKRTTPVQC